MINIGQNQPSQKSSTLDPNPLKASLPAAAAWLVLFWPCECVIPLQDCLLFIMFLQFILLLVLNILHRGFELWLHLFNWTLKMPFDERRDRNGRPWRAAKRGAVFRWKSSWSTDAATAVLEVPVVTTWSWGKQLCVPSPGHSGYKPINAGTHAHRQWCRLPWVCRQLLEGLTHYAPPNPPVHAPGGGHMSCRAPFIQGETRKTWQVATMTTVGWVKPCSMSLHVGWLMESPLLSCLLPFFHWNRRNAGYLSWCSSVLYPLPSDWVSTFFFVPGLHRPASICNCGCWRSAESGQVSGYPKSISNQFTRRNCLGVDCFSKLFHLKSCYYPCGSSWGRVQSIVAARTRCHLNVS